MKTCSKCKIEKPRSEFNKHSTSKDGLQPRCKSCRAIDAKEYGDPRREELNAKSSEYRKNHPEKRKATQRKYYEANCDRESQMAALRYEKDPAKFKARNDAWRARNPEAVRIRVQNRRARKNFSGEKLSAGIFEVLFEKQQGLCAACFSDLTVAEPHIDHIMPLALKGPNTDDNVQLLCARCNRTKGAKHPEKFAAIVLDKIIRGAILLPNGS